MALSISECTEAELSEILPIWTYIVTKTKLTPESDSASIDYLIAQYRLVKSAGYPYFITRKGNKVVGWCFIRRYASVTDTAFRFSAVAESWIAPEAMNDGVGRLHQQALLQRLRTLPIKELMTPITEEYRANLAAFGLDFPGSRELGGLENMCEKNGEQYSLYVRQLTTGWMPRL